MNQQTCLALPHHFTHLGVCYPGENAYIGISNPTNPHQVSFTVGAPEPGTFSLMAIGLLALIAARCVRPARS